MTSPELPRPDEQPENSESARHRELFAGFEREMLDDFDPDTALPELGEVSGFTESMMLLHAQRSQVLELLVQCYEKPIVVDQLAPLVVAQARSYINTYQKVMDEAVATTDNTDNLVNEIVTITSTEFDECMQVFTALSDRLAFNAADMKRQIREVVNGEVETYITDAADPNPSMIALHLTVLFNDQMRDAITAVIDDVPEATEERMQLMRRAQILHAIGDTARQAVAIAAGVAAGMIIAHKFTKR